MHSLTLRILKWIIQFIDSLFLHDFQLLQKNEVLFENHDKYYGFYKANNVREVCVNGSKQLRDQKL